MRITQLLILARIAHRFCEFGVIERELLGTESIERAMRRTYRRIRSFSGVGGNHYHDYRVVMRLFAKSKAQTTLSER